MGTWSTATSLAGAPERVLDVLTDPEACREWSPLPFEVATLRDGRLATGTRAQVGGRLAGRSVSFDVDILRADESALELRAVGPIDIEARYRAVAEGCCSTRLEASVTVRPGGGLAGRILSSATDALLAAGVLDRAVGRIAQVAAG